jgi:hypothetical protein
LANLLAVSRRYVWIYAAVQFLFVVFFTHLFYRYVSEHEEFVTAVRTVTFHGVLNQAVVFRAAAFAGRDIHHPGDLRWVRRGDDRELHHRRGTTVEDAADGAPSSSYPGTPWSKRTCSSAAAAAAGPRA